MVTYFNRKDLVSFGAYLLSENRKRRMQDTYDIATSDGKKALPIDEASKEVYHADIENWMSGLKK